MTTTSLIALNALFATAAVAAILALLSHGIRSGRPAERRFAEPWTLDTETRDRLAA